MSENNEDIKVVEEAASEVKEAVAETVAPVVEEAAPVTPAVEAAPVIAPIINPVAEAVKEAAPAPAAPAVDPKAAAKAEKEAKKAAEKAQKDAQKAAAKADKKAKKDEAQKAKNVQKAAERQAKIDACPKEYKPVSTSKYFWLYFLSGLPVLGIVVTIIMMIIPKNKNIKSFMRAVFAWQIVFCVLALIGTVVFVATTGASLDGIIHAFKYFIEELASA